MEETAFACGALCLFCIRLYTGYMKNIQVFTALIALSFALIVGVVVRYTSAADVTTTAEITNTAPVIDAIRVSTIAYGGNDLTIHINGQITDLSGESDIASSTLSLVFHRTSSTNTCPADKNDCYRITACDTNYADGDDTQITYDCPVPLAYWIDATDAASDYASDTWTSYVTVSDLAAAQAIRSATIEVNSLLALNIPTAIDYGNRTLSEQSSGATNVETVLTQRGNTKADVQVSGTAMGCNALGSLPIAAQAWALTDTGFASSTTLTGTLAATFRNINLRTDDVSELAASLYWNIGIPASGVKGICTGANTILIIVQAPPEGALTQYGTVQYAGGPYDEAGTTQNMGGYYRTVTIGTQTWFKDNLNAGVMLASGSINPTNDGVIQKWCYSNSTTNCNTEGGLYDWDEAMSYGTTEGAQGICPSGWHIPSQAEYTTLITFLGSESGTKLKEYGSSGFEGKLSGARDITGVYVYATSYGYFWSSTTSGIGAWAVYLYSGLNAAGGIDRYKSIGESLRCLKN